MDQYNSRQQTIVAHCSDNNRRGLEVLSVKLTPQDFIGNPATTGIPQGQDANITYYDVSVATAGVPPIFALPTNVPPPPNQTGSSNYYGAASDQSSLNEQNPHKEISSDNYYQVTGQNSKPGQEKTIESNQAQRLEEVRNDIEDHRLCGRGLKHYRDHDSVAGIVPWVLFGLGWLFGPLWWFGACFIASKHRTARIAGLLNLIFGVAWIITFAIVMGFCFSSNCHGMWYH